MSRAQQTPSSITTVIFDYGEVLSIRPPEAVRARLVELSGAPPEKFWAAYWAERLDYDAGLSALEYWSRIGDRLGAVWNSAVRQELWATDVGAWLLPDPRALALVERIAGGPARLALLSNAPTDIAGALRASPLLAGFDALFFSCDLGLCKPDPAIYRHVLDTLGDTPERTVFIDDREENTRAAAKLGITTHRYTGIPELAGFLTRALGTD